jgi:DNA-directed RNA polymerase specialized sigma24 family protein
VWLLEVNGHPDMSATSPLKTAMVNRLYEEIADIMHMGLSATKMRYKRALDKLREKFAGSTET